MHSSYSASSAAGSGGAGGVGGVGGVGGAAGGVTGGYGGQAPSERTPGTATNDQTLKSLQKHYMNAITSLNPTLPALNVSQLKQYLQCKIYYLFTL